MKGLCHSCLTPNVELVTEKGQILCFDCFGKKHQGKSPENQEASFKKLKEKWEKK